MAVMAYYRRDLFAMVGGAGKAVTQRTMNDDLKLGLLVVLAIIPAVVFGFLGDDWIERELRSALVIACTTIGFGLLLWYADKKAALNKHIYDMTWKSALIVGMAQAIALIPGTSRSGITMTAGLMLGLDRESAARFSFLLSIPVILGAGLLATLDLVSAPDAVDWNALIVGAVLSFVSAYACIYLFLAWISRIGMLPFVIYRMLLGVILLLFVFA